MPSALGRAHFGSSTECERSVPIKAGELQSRCYFTSYPTSYIGIIPSASAVIDRSPTTIPPAASGRVTARNAGDSPPVAAPARPMETTILVVAAHTLVRDGLRSVLGEIPGFSVVGDARDVRSAVSIAAMCKPDVVLLDQSPCNPPEHSAVSELRANLPGTCLLCLASDAQNPPGDLLCVPPSAGVDGLCSVLGGVLGGGCADCSLKPRCVAPQIAVALSRRERQVAVCVARGMASKQIAAALGIALRTVNTYRESLAKKLGASSGAVVTRFVLEAKLEGLGPPEYLP